ncbi:MAG: terminase family protein [Clostridiales bacterium]|nr:terminase family protein [Clostridiales bacterium]
MSTIIAGGGADILADNAEKGKRKKKGEYRRVAADEAEETLLRRLVLNRKRLAAYKRKNKLEAYNTGALVHEKQVAFHKCLKRNRWVFGGNRTGKTECGAAETAYLLRGNHPYRKVRGAVTGWAVSVSYGAGREVAQKKLLSYLNPDWIAQIGMIKGAKSSEGGIVDFIAVKNVFGTVSTVYFKSCEAGREKFQGSSLDFVWFDEEPPEDIYEECRMRVFDRKGELYGTMTPLKGMTYIYDKIYLNASSDPEVWCEFMEWADNPYLDKGEIERLSAALDKQTLATRRFGAFADTCDRVYPEFDENVHVIPPFSVPPEWQDTLSIDPGLNNPLSCHWYATDYDGNVYVLAEHFEAGRDVAYHCGEILRISKAIGWRAMPPTALIDSAASQRTLAAVKSVTELFCEHGVRVNPRVNKDLFTGINRVKSYLAGENGRPRLFIFASCKNLIRELKAYRYGAGDVPVKADDHALDELRYYLMTKPQLKLPPSEKSELLRFKEKLLTARVKRL